MSKLKDVLLHRDAVVILRRMVADGTLAELEPSLAALHMEIPRGYHHKDNLAHSIKVLENAIKREQGEPDLILRTAALFHDIGKPATRKFGSKRSVTFTGHEIVGARMVRKILRTHGYSKAQISEVSNLVAFHMRSHGFTPKLWTDSAVRRLITDAGSEETLNRLIILFYSDLTTGQDKLRSEVTAGLDSLVEKIALVRKQDARRSLRPAVDAYVIMGRYGMEPGPALGSVMRFLNSDEGVSLPRDEEFAAVESKFGLTPKD
jgi:poly(A) polymerase